MSGDRAVTRRSGRWHYGDHADLNPGWRLVGTSLVLDFDPDNCSGTPRGCYVLWRHGQYREPVDHYLDRAMDYVERHLAEFIGEVQSNG